MNEIILYYVNDSLCALHCVSFRKPSRLTLFIASHEEHTYTVWTNAEFFSVERGGK
jgi:hypothetical protein